MLAALLVGGSVHGQSALKAQPLDAGQLLDKALEACAAGRTQEALSGLSALEALSPPDSIRLVIRAAQSTGCGAPALASQPAPQAAQVGGFWSVGRASNVNAAPQDGVIRFPELSPLESLTLAPEERPRHDGFTSLGLQALSPVITTYGLRLSAAGQLRRYAQETAYRSSQVVLGLEQPLPMLGGSLQLQLGHWRFGDDGQDSQARLAWEGRFVVRQGFALGYGLGVASAFTQASTRSRAHRADASLWGQWTLNPFQLGAAVGEGQDHLAEGSRIGGDRRSQQAQLQLQAPLGDPLRVSLAAAWVRQTDSQPYNAVFFGEQPRHSHRLLLSASLETQRPLIRLGQARLHGFVSFQHERVNDRIPLFTQQSQAVSLGFAAPLR